MRTKEMKGYLKRLILRIITPNDSYYKEKKEKVSTPEFQPGDLVRVLSKQAIQETFGESNRLKGCTFVDEMWQYCGTVQKVRKQMKQFKDERDYFMKKCKGLVLLENVTCEGQGCDRSCYYFWRVEWLEKINAADQSLA